MQSKGQQNQRYALVAVLMCEDFKLILSQYPAAAINLLHSRPTSRSRRHIPHLNKFLWHSIVAKHLYVLEPKIWFMWGLLIAVLRHSWNILKPPLWIEPQTQEPYAQLLRNSLHLKAGKVKPSAVHRLHLTSSFQLEPAYI
jgi:hypothetical protein